MSRCRTRESAAPNECVLISIAYPRTKIDIFSDLFEIRKLSAALLLHTSVSPYISAAVTLYTEALYRAITRSIY